MRPPSMRLPSMRRPLAPKGSLAALAPPWALAALALALLGSGCSPGSAGRGAASSTLGTTAAGSSAVGSGAAGSPAPGAPGAPSTLASASTGGPPVSSAPGSLPATTAAPDDGTVPVVFVHGWTGDCSDFDALLDRLGHGRPVVRRLYADDADALAVGSLAPDVLVNFGYYQRSTTAQRFDPDPQGLSHGSIGSCPVPRDDRLDLTYYSTSYAERLRHCVEGVKRATGKSQVDLVCHSMGGLVGRAYVKWLSLDASGRSSVRRIFLIGSPGRGINALEALAIASDRGPDTGFMRLGECVELCYEARIYQGRSFVEVLDDGWDGFCAAHGIRYAGVSGTGSLGALNVYLSGLSALQRVTPQAVAALVAVAAVAYKDLPREIQEATSESDDTIHTSSSRLDQPPFQQADAWTLYEGFHAWPTPGDPDRCINACGVTAELVRGFSIASGRGLPVGARCDRLDVSQVDAPGRASWVQVDVKISGTGALGVQLVEETLDPFGLTASYDSACQGLRTGEQRLLFAVHAGGGRRRYRVVVYGERGPIDSRAGVVLDMKDGALEAGPRATIGQVTPAPTAAGPVARLAFGSNAAPGDPALAYRVRFDHGDWQGPTAAASFDTPPLGAGLHRVEVVATSSSNGAGVTVDGSEPAAVDLLVDAGGNVQVTR